MADKTLPDLPRRTDTVERWCAWATTALHAEEIPIVGVYSLTSDDGAEAAIVIQLANRHEILICPARTLASRRISDEFVVLGCPVPYYSPAQIQVIATAIGTIARRSRIEQNETRSYVEFSSLGAEWIERCRRHSPIIELTGRDGPAVRSAISRVRSTTAERDVDRLGPPSIIHDLAADELLIWTTPFRRYVRERRGTTSDDLLGVQMQRAGWRRVRLAARPGPGQKGTVEMPVWSVPNGFQGSNLENTSFPGILQADSENVVDRSDLSTYVRTHAHGLNRTVYNAQRDQDDWQTFRHAVAGEIQI
jgi:hypothetical protein